MNRRFDEQVERELAGGLVYTFSILENVTRPGAGKIRIFDRFRIRVSVANRTSIPLRDLRGVIARTDLADFEPRPFQLDRLEPQATAQLAEIEARIVREPGSTFLMDQVGVVSACAVADLSTLEYQEWDKPLVHGDSYSLNGGRATRPRAENDDNPFWGPTIPLARR